MAARNLGAVLLSRTGQTQDAIAEAIGVSRVAVSYWMTGEKKPGKARGKNDEPDARTKLFERYGVPIDAWDQEPPKVAKKPRPTPEPAAAVVTAPIAPDSVLQRAERLGVMVDELMQELQTDVGALPMERAKVMSAAAQTLALLGKLLGQFDLGTRFFRLPLWREVERALERGLTGHPDAAAAVARELRRVEAESGYKRP